jgi:hypothetical protein
LQSALPFAGSGFVYRGRMRGRDKALDFAGGFRAIKPQHGACRDFLKSFMPQATSLELEAV